MTYLKLIGGATLACLSAACSVGPVYRMPVIEATPAFAAGLPAPQAGAASSARLDDWWRQFDDPLVAELVATAFSDSPDLAAAAARIGQARARAGVAAAARWPTLDANFDTSRGRSAVLPGQGATGSATNRHLDAAWEVDLFGGVAKARESALAHLAARGADWHAARVSLAAEVALTLVRYRACGLTADVLNEDVLSHRQTSELTALKVKNGFTAPADGALIDAASADARQRLAAQRAECDMDVQSLAALTGMTEAALRAKLGAGGALPVPRGIVVEQVPAQVLAQRPDIAAAERDLAAAGADINVAQADRYPHLSLLGSIGTASARLDGSSGNVGIWSFGPTLNLPLFDGGRRVAEVEAAQARYDEQYAVYRQQVRSAVQEIEQALVRLAAAAQREDDAQTAAREYERYVAAGMERFRVGSGSLFELEEARGNARGAQQTLIEVRQERVAAWIALYKALGGGWHAGVDEGGLLAANPISTPGKLKP